MSDDGRGGESSLSAGRGGIDPMLNAKLTRRKVQQDVELMGNRIERLRAEERKAKQKVLETKLRGQEIIQLQKRNQQAHAAKELSKRIETEQHTRDQQSQQLRRIEHRAALKSTYESMHAARREEVKAERRIKAENADAVTQTRAYEIARAQKAQQAIRHHQQMVHARFDKQRQAHREFLAQDFINMIAMEDRRREEIERDIASLEIEERSHIERLRALQVCCVRRDHGPRREEHSHTPRTPRTHRAHRAPRAHRASRAPRAPCTPPYTPHAPMHPLQEEQKTAYYPYHYP